MCTMHAPHVLEGILGLACALHNTFGAYSLEKASVFRCLLCIVLVEGLFTGAFYFSVGAYNGSLVRKSTKRRGGSLSLAF